ncbi:hypothetical protein IKG06_02475 [Candidatus Saccharibacteria bacterium]|nr:hypothetical protein [Candidatus Saccharibacteria bacterium]
MNSKEEKVFVHHCPVCQYHTEEVYLLEHNYLQTYSTWKTHYYFRYERQNQKPFERYAEDNGSRAFLICPKCGVVLSANYAETEIQPDEETSAGT